MLKEDKIWNEIKNENDINVLMNVYGAFHDSCIRDIYISTKEYVDKKLTMNFESNIIISLLFQRQFSPKSVIEVKFENVLQFNFKPLSSIDNIILDATLVINENVIYWADYADWKIGDNDAVWISGKRMFWREVSESLGKINRILL